MANESAECRVFVMDPGASALADAAIYGDMASHPDRLRALARALAASPGFRAMDDAALVVRTEEPAKLALLGRRLPGPGGGP